VLLLLLHTGSTPVSLKFRSVWLYSTWNRKGGYSGILYVFFFSLIILDPVSFKCLHPFLLMFSSSIFCFLVFFYYFVVCCVFSGPPCFVSYWNRFTLARQEVAFNCTASFNLVKNNKYYWCPNCLSDLARYSGNRPDLYSGGPRFGSLAGHRLSWLENFCCFLQFFQANAGIVTRPPTLFFYVFILKPSGHGIAAKATADQLMWQEIVYGWSEWKIRPIWYLVIFIQLVAADVLTA
jgi:hypothetical protein